ncbi:MAG TPA: PadR family transcriptional regulator, partial [Acidobacteriota bacterium]|nr:PadR family transcriptional regulator [Acidobacteriota bacterium]
GVAVRIKQISKNVLQVNQGSLYPALRRLEKRGWIEAEWGESENNRRARFYRLTKAGRKQLSQETEEWQRLAEAVARVLQTENQ